MRTLPQLAAVALALGALACAGAPAAAHQGAAPADGATLTDLAARGAGGCPETGARERMFADPAGPAEPRTGGAAVVAALDADPARAAGPQLACGTLSSARVPSIPEGGTGGGPEGAARSGNAAALAVAGAGALSVVGSAVVAQRRTAARH